MKQNKKLTYPVIGAFVCFLFAVLFLSLTTPQVAHNERENKDLSQRVLLSECSSFDEFAKSFDLFVSDQFPFRSRMIAKLNAIEIAQGSSVVQDVYVLDSDYLFTFVYPTEAWRPVAIGKRMLSKQELHDIPFVFVSVPQKNMLLEEGVPGLSATTDWDNLEKMKKGLEESNIKFIEACHYMAGLDLEEKSKMYFKTDIHWNDKGAFICAKYVAKQLADMDLLRKAAIPHDSDFSWYDYSGKEFSGDIGRRFGIESNFEEYIPVYTLNGADSCYYYNSLDDSSELAREDVIFTGLYSDDVLTYSTLSMDNYPYIRIENPHANEDKSILILKDSLQCATVDYFSQMFSEINIVDPRYYQSTYDIDTIINERDVDMVLCFYHCNNASKELIDYLQ